LVLGAIRGWPNVTVSASAAHLAASPPRDVYSAWSPVTVVEGFSGHTSPPAGAASATVCLPRDSPARFTAPAFCAPSCGARSGCVHTVPLNPWWAYGWCCHSSGPWSLLFAQAGQSLIRSLPLILLAAFAGRRPSQWQWRRANVGELNSWFTMPTVPGLSANEARPAVGLREVRHGVAPVLLGCAIRA
jgi:hypothetical protein